jgi:programmed cell death protein 4
LTHINFTFYRNPESFTAVATQMSTKGNRKVKADEFTRKKGVNDRSKDRELEKKQGGHGKGRREADETLEPVQVLGEGDPNFDELKKEGAILTTDEFVGSPPRNAYVTQRHFQPCKHSLPEFKKAVIKIITEYFSAEDVEEVGRSLAELESPFFHYEFVKRVITMSMDRKEKERELVSRLLSALYAYDRGLLSTNQIGKGFERLFEVVDDLELDIPSARPILTQFLARAVVDELLPPSFLSDPLVEGMGGEVVENAIKMLSTYHGTSRVEKVWGPGDGRSVPELKTATDQLCQEYLLSQDLEEAIR